MPEEKLLCDIDHLASTSFDVSSENEDFFTGFLLCKCVRLLTGGSEVLSSHKQAIYNHVSTTLYQTFLNESISSMSVNSTDYVGIRKRWLFYPSQRLLEISSQSLCPIFAAQFPIRPNHPQPSK